MTVTTSFLTRAAGAAAATAGLVFVGVQVGHPHLGVETITTTEVVVRNSLKVAMAVLALVGITGMYLSQVRRNGVLGLAGYLLLAVGYLCIVTTSVVAAAVLPGITASDPSYVADVLTVSTGGRAEGDIGALAAVFRLQGFGYLAGGLLLGVALFRARVLTRWASALLAVGGLVSVVLTYLPDAFYRLLAYPNAIAMLALGISLFRTAGRRDDPAASTTVGPAAAVSTPAST